MKSAEIRQAFLSFFAEKQHTVVPSSSLVPSNDPTLLFTNAGMVPFKDVFLGDEKRDYVRATSSQRCVRAGGKHNDLENVGYTARHHTFFEMLGNFSFGDYFKREAITYAWEFLTDERWLKLPKERLWVTVYEEDDEAYQIWAQEVGIPAERLIRIGDNKGGRYQSDNFWSMGETGPCGPCTEIFYDHGEHIWGGPPGSPEEDGDRYIEIWNNVFMQFNRSADGIMNPLPAPSVDTGMGLERITAVMQHVNSNYEIDSFQSLLKAAAVATGCDDLQSKSLRVIADHLRSCAFLVVDGVLPSNEGRGYVLRRIMRRAIRHGHKLGQPEPFFHTLVSALVDEMRDAYPELVELQGKIEAAFLAEENQFAKTLDKGMAVLEGAIAAAEQASGQSLKELSGELVFTLYDTYGFPLDLTADIARERSLSIDEAGYDNLMARQKEQSRAAGSFKVDYSAQLSLDVATEFLGYEQLQSSAKVVAILQNGENVNCLENDQEACLVLDQTPFYAESGGQVGDKGVIYTDAGRFDVHDCVKQGDSFIHIGVLSEGSLSADQAVTAQVLEDLRIKTAANHSATHLLHAALRHVLGDQVVQKGSLCDSERLRFDFACGEAVSLEQMRTVEQLVNAQIRANTEVVTDVTDMETAKAKGAMALFGEKYSDSVRVLSMGINDFSVELCGGTHVKRTGDIGLLRIVSESGVAAGVRRIEAVTGEAAIAMAYESEDLVRSVCQMIKAKPDTLIAKTDALKADVKALEKALSSAKSRLALAASAELVNQAQTVAGLSVLAVHIDGADAKGLASTADHLKEKLGEAVMLLIASEGEKVSLLANVSKSLTPKLKAGALIQAVAPIVGGKGGGRPDMARGAGTQPENIPAALKAVVTWVEEQAV